jgi:hypothetical protein
MVTGLKEVLSPRPREESVSGPSAAIGQRELRRVRWSIKGLFWEPGRKRKNHLRIRRQEHFNTLAPLH